MRKGKFHPSFLKSVLEATASADPCGCKCDYRTDSCSNTFGPGCYTSCPGSAVPLFTAPICVTAALPILTVLVTPVPVMSTMTLMVPQGALDKKQAEDTASSTLADGSPSMTDASSTSIDASSTAIDALSTSIDASSTFTCFKGVGCDASSTSIDASSTSTDLIIITAGNGTGAANATSPPLNTPVPIPEGGATVGAQLSTIAPQSYGYLSVADIMDPPATAADVPASEPTPETLASSTMVDDGAQMPNSAIFSVHYVSSTDATSTTDSVSSIDISSTTEYLTVLTTATAAADS